MWKVKIDRPEEIHDSPILYYTEEEVQKYSKSKSMKRKQEKLTARLIELMDISPPGIILDMGCGPGFSTGFLKELGFSVFGIDVVQDMVKTAKQRGLEVELIDMRKLYSLGKKFDYIISVSAFQWIRLDEISVVAQGIKKILRKKGMVGIQFYPKSEREMIQIGRIFSKNGFSGNFVVDNEKSPRKRTIYLILKFL